MNNGFVFKLMVVLVLKMDLGVVLASDQATQYSFSCYLKLGAIQSAYSCNDFTSADLSDIEKLKFFCALGAEEGENTFFMTDELCEPDFDYLCLVDSGAELVPTYFYVASSEAKKEAKKLASQSCENMGGKFE